MGEEKKSVLSLYEAEQEQMLVTKQQETNSKNYNCYGGFIRLIESLKQTFCDLEYI